MELKTYNKSLLHGIIRSLRMRWAYCFVLKLCIYLREVFLTIKSILIVSIFKALIGLIIILKLCILLVLLFISRLTMVYRLLMIWDRLAPRVVMGTICRRRRWASFLFCSSLTHVLHQSLMSDAFFMPWYLFLSSG